jgi:hypothetical protein
MFISADYFRLSKTNKLFNVSKKRRGVENLVVTTIIYTGVVQELSLLCFERVRSLLNQSWFDYNGSILRAVQVMYKRV